MLCNNGDNDHSDYHELASTEHQVPCVFTTGDACDSPQKWGHCSRSPARGVSFHRGSPLAVCLAASNWQLGHDSISYSKFIVFLQLQSLARDGNCELLLLFFSCIKSPFLNALINTSMLASNTILFYQRRGGREKQIIFYLYLRKKPCFKSMR